MRQRLPALTRLALQRVLAALAALALQACSSILHVPDGATYRSADAERTAVVRQGRVVVDGRPGAPQFDGIALGGVSLSRDGARVAYVGMRGSKTFLVVDDREYGPFDAVSKEGVRMSANGRRVALTVIRDGRWHVWLDGALSKPYDGIAAGHPVFSGDAAQTAYAARNGTEWTLVHDGVEQPLGKGLLDDFGFTAAGELYAAYQQADGWRVRVGSAVSQALEQINKPGLMLSPDRRAVAFIARKDQQVVVCVNLACGRGHRSVGARVQVDGSSFGDELVNAVLIGALAGVVGARANIPAHTNPLLTTPVGSKPARYAIVGSVVFSPGIRHHAYVASDEGEAIMLDGATAVPVPADKAVEWMRFDDSSQVLMYRMAGSSELLGAALPAAARHADADDPARAANVNLTLAKDGALVFVDGRYAGVSPRRLALTAGEHELRVQSPGRASRSVRVNAVAGRELAVDLDAAPDPVRAAVSAAIAALDEPHLASAAKVRPEQLLRSRLLARVPLSEEVLGVAAYGAGGHALVFGDSAIHVYTEYSSRSSSSQHSVVPYAEFARQPLPTDHRAFEVALTPNVVVMTAGMSLSKERLLVFLESLRTQLAAALDAGERASAQR